MSNTKKPTVFDILSSCDKDYQERVKKAAKKKSSLLIPFGTFEHAVLVTYYLIKNAKKEVRVFTNRGNRLFCDPRIDSVINEAIKRGVEFKILFEQKKSNKTDFVLGSFECRSLRKKIRSFEVKQYFLISDSCGFSLNHPGKQTEGEISFKDSEGCKNLRKIFDFYFNPKSKS